MTNSRNRLGAETSPYLRQHRHNPVDWHPWGPEALGRAQREQKPILLSIGYSACHWCHVMERESFENEHIATLMNELFVNIKVDREERPDIDHIYMTAVQMMTGRGGWPLTVFLTPDGKPFYGGTYFPPEDRHNLPGFPRVLQAVAHAYRERPAEVQETVGRLLTSLRRADAYQPTRDTLDGTTVVRGAEALAQAYDPVHGGLGSAPKFPHPGALELFLRAADATGERPYLDMVTHTLRRMAAGGIYDQLGGGFHRYAVDARWLVPHFEKMLYDNAQLARLYLDCYQASGERFFADVAADVLRYVSREMRHPDGGFFSTQDADSDGGEGAFFVWTVAEIRAALGDADADLFCRFYDVTREGNFEGKNILHPVLDVDEVAVQAGIAPEAARRRLAEARRTLFAVREGRPKPGLDDKILASWNGLMISAFARAASVLGAEQHLDVARAAVAFIFRVLWRDGRLLGTVRGGTAKLNAYLDDYAFLAASLIDLFEASQDRTALDRACALMRVLDEHFWDPVGGGFYLTSDDHETLIVRSKPGTDGSVPSGNAVAAQTLLRLYHYTGNGHHLERAETVLRMLHEPMRQQPFAFAHALCVLDLFARGATEIVIVGPRQAPDTKELLERLHARYLPNKTIQVVDPATGVLPTLLAGKGQVNGQVTTYVCRRGTCSLPATAWIDVERLLA